MGRVLRLRKKDTSSTTCSESSQSSDSSSAKSQSGINATSISRNLKSSDNRKKIKDKVNSIQADKKVTAGKIVNVPGSVSDSCSDENSASSKNERVVLVDKTNSMLNGNVDRIEGEKTAQSVYFVSQDKIKKLPKTTRMVKEEKRKAVHNDDVGSKSENGNTCDNNSAKIVSENKVHVPIYNLPVVNGRKSFHLTPPTVEDKNALYEFAVDENEPVTKRKRRPVRMLNRKRLCKIVNDVKGNELNSIPHRTMALRNDGQEGKARVNYKELNDSDVRESTDLGLQLKSNTAILNRNTYLNSKQNYGRLISNNKGTIRRNKENFTKRVDFVTADNTKKMVLKQQNGEQSSVGKSVNKEVPIVEEVCGILNDTPLPVNVENGCMLTSSNKSLIVENEKSINSSAINRTCKKVSDNLLEPVSGKKAESSSNSFSNRIDLSHQMNEVSICTSASASPFPEYSRIGEGVQVGPLYNTSLNCTEVEYNNDFIRGVTASTPVRVTNPNRTIANSNLQVRLSGGEQGFNRCNFSVIRESDDNDNDNDAFFGFSNDEISKESSHRMWGNKTPTPCLPNEVSPTSCEPLQKISVSEVITLLKRDLNAQKKRTKAKNKVMFQTLYDNSARHSSSHLEGYLNGSDSSSSQDQPSINSFMNLTGEPAESKNGDNPKDLDKTFVNPPRRSYSITPRRAKRVEHCVEEVESEGDAPIEKVEYKKAQKKPKISKKEAKQIEKQAAMMNSQFSEIDKFDLVVE